MKKRNHGFTRMNTDERMKIQDKLLIEINSKLLPHSPSDTLLLLIRVHPYESVVPISVPLI